jgi:Bacterial membrane protein YfhO
VKPGLLLLAIVGAASYVVGSRLGEHGGGVPAFDVYGYFYPNILHALRSIAAGGGLLWNPYQNCGQPFFAISSVGLLYPANVLFLLLAPSTALRAVLFANLVVGGLGARALARELGLDTAGALAGTLAFMLGGTAVGLTVWMPTVQAAYAWMPAALLFCERLVRTGRLREGLWLGVVLAMALLPGHPQFTLLSCELVCVRLLWSLGDASERRHFGSAAAGVALALLLMILLTAVQYLPAMEVAAESVRGASGPWISPGGRMTWHDLSLGVRLHTVQVPFAVVPGFVAAAALANGRRRRAALFYTFAAGLFLVLAFGDATPLGRLYAATPPGMAFRMPVRFAYVTGFCLSVLTGIAVEALLRGGLLAVALSAAALAACRAWVGGLYDAEWFLAAAVLSGGCVAAVAPARRFPAATLVVGAVGLSLVLVPAWTLQRYLPDDNALLRAHAGVFENLEARLTAQDRVHLARPMSDLGFEDKTASLFGLRATTDYEGQVTRTYAEYVTMLRTGQLLRHLDQVIYPPPWNPGAVRWPLLRLAAARYLAVAPEFDLPVDTGGLLVPFDGDANVHLYEHPDALPRTYYVPRVAVVADADARLERLAAGIEDPRRVALVEEPPPSGFVGVPGNDATAGARFVADEPEHLVVELNAPERGFLFLADQYFPGWSATVNGRPAPIVRANHAFRLVEVPRGQVRVEFRYRPVRVWVGAVISAMTLAAVAAALVWTRPRSG